MSKRMPPTARARRAAAAVAAAAALACAAATAQTVPASNRPAVSAQAVEQKLTMVERLLNQPGMTQRLQSGNEAARSAWTAARDLYAHARALAITGLLRGADALLNEAIWEISRAQQAAPDQQARAREERARYTQLHDSVDALLRTYQIGLHPGAVSGRPNDPAERSLQRAMASLEQARTLAQAEKHADANKLLDGALAGLLKDSASRLNGQTIVYDRRFGSAKEEFAFELERNRSLEGLVPLALVEFRPPPEAIALIDRYVKQNVGLRQRAETQAAAGDATAGLKTLNEGTDSLQRALQAAGLSVPQTMGSQ